MTSCIMRKKLTPTFPADKLPMMLFQIGTGTDATIVVPLRLKPHKSFALGQMVIRVEVECNFHSQSLQSLAEILQHFHDIVDQLSHVNKNSEAKWKLLLERQVTVFTRTVDISPAGVTHAMAI